MAWQRFRVELKGDDAPTEVQTTARDWAGVTIDADAPKAMDMTFRVVHAALVREGRSVPRNYDAFLEVLDGMPQSIDDDGESPTDPTDATPSDVSP